jgi:DNA-binding transcriptional LysR family regulator
VPAATSDSYGPIPEKRWLDEALLSHRVVARMSSTRGLMAAAAAGAGLAILPDLLAKRAGLSPFDLSGKRPLPDRDVWLVWHRALSRDKQARQVIAWITSIFEKLS